MAMVIHQAHGLNIKTVMVRFFVEYVLYPIVLELRVGAF
jgi:hypothetical protein